ncbi:unnamed protein product [Brassica rapa subsp. trilocularis]
MASLSPLSNLLNLDLSDSKKIIAEYIWFHHICMSYRFFDLCLHVSVYKHNCFLTLLCFGKNRIGGSGMDIRSKGRTLPGPVSDPSKLPKWNHDGSSTNQAAGDDSEVILYPQAIFKDPFRKGK